MIFTCSNNPIMKFECWFENSIVQPLSRYYYSKKKSHYQCTVCGRIEAPYFTGEKYASLTKDMGWHKFNVPIMDLSLFSKKIIMVIRGMSGKHLSVKIIVKYLRPLKIKILSIMIIGLMEAVNASYLET